MLFIAALVSDSDVNCDYVEKQHTINFDRYETWVNYRIADKDE